MKHFTLACANNYEVPWQKAVSLLYLIDAHLNNSVIEKIYDKFIGLLNKRLVNANKKLVISETAKRKIIEEGYDEEFGARPLKRYIQQKIETMIARKLLQSDLKPNQTINIDEENGEFIILIK